MKTIPIVKGRKYKITSAPMGEMVGNIIIIEAVGDTYVRWRYLTGPWKDGNGESAWWVWQPGALKPFLI